MQRLFVWGALALVLVGVAGCQGSTSTTSTPAAAPVRWIIAGQTLHEIALLDATVAQVAFDRPTTFVIRGQRGAGAPSGWSSTLVADYKSYAQLESDFSSGSFPTGVRAVLYDDEAWAFTPPGEQQDPGRYIQLAAQICHQHGLMLIAAPAIDLVKVLMPSATNSHAAYLSLGLAATAAKYADVVDIQAQSLEADATAYRSFVAAAATQARHAGSAQLLVLAGLSTGPAGQQVTAAQITAAADAARGLVEGYWLNVPGQSAECPTCSTPRPDLAVAFLKQQYHS